MDFNVEYYIIKFTHELGLSMTEVSELYSEFILEINSAVSELKILINKQDLEKTQRIIHNIKGVSGNYRIIDIYKESAKINDALKDNNYNTLGKDLNYLFYISDIAIKEIERFFYQRHIYIYEYICNKGHSII